MIYLTRPRSDAGNDNGKFQISDKAELEIEKSCKLARDSSDFISLFDYGKICFKSLIY